jgi:hypothetical protein
MHFLQCAFLKCTRTFPRSTPARSLFGPVQLSARQNQIAKKQTTTVQTKNWLLNMMHGDSAKTDALPT